VSENEAMDLARESDPRARKRIGLVAMAFAYRALAALAIALPAAAAVGAATAAYPRAQDELFDAGGLMLIESLRVTRRAAPAIFATGGLVAVTAAVLGVFPLGVLIAGLGRKGRLDAGFVVGRAWAHAGTLAILYGLGAVAQVVIGALIGLLGGKLVPALSLRTPNDDLAGIGVALVALAAAAIVGVLRDLAFVAAVHGEQRFYGACVHAVRVARARFGRAIGAWGWRWALGFAGFALAIALAPQPAGAGAGAVALGALLHWGAIFGIVAARGSWLAASMRLYDGVIVIEPPVTMGPQAAPNPGPAEPALSAAAPAEPSGPTDQP
jgi:hypothetical protein